MPRSLMTFLIIAVLSFMSSESAFCAGKVRDWHTGIVLDSTNPSQSDVNPVCVTFRIEGEMYAYLAQERLKRRWSKPANLTANAPVRFAVVDRELFVLDKHGKEHKMEIVKKVLRQPMEHRKPKPIAA